MAFASNRQAREAGDLSVDLERAALRAVRSAYAELNFSLFGERLTKCQCEFVAASARLEKTLPLWVACLSGLSYPMILYSSEARGYAPVMFSAVFAYYMFQRCLERCTALKLILFWTAMALGILSHFSFIMVCLALGLWSLAHDHFAGASLRMLVLNALKYFGVPLVFLAGI